MKGKLKIIINKKEFNLNEGEAITILPGQKHWSIGKETWVKTTSNPGWTLEDHLLAKTKGHTFPR